MKIPKREELALEFLKILLGRTDLSAKIKDIVEASFDTADIFLKELNKNEPNQTNSQIKP